MRFNFGNCSLINPRLKFDVNGTLISHQGLHCFPVFRQDPIDTMSESSRCFRNCNFNALQVGCVYLFIYRYTVHVLVDIRVGGCMDFPCRLTPDVTVENLSGGFNYCINDPI